MWCYIRNFECYKTYCDGCCPYNFPLLQNQFNYECLDCHGKFNQAVYKLIIKAIKDIDTGNIVHEESLGYKFVCPFCERIIEGLN